MFSLREEISKTKSYLEKPKLTLNNMLPQHYLQNEKLLSFARYEQFAIVKT